MGLKRNQDGKVRRRTMGSLAKIKTENVHLSMEMRD